MRDSVASWLGLNSSWIESLKTPLALHDGRSWHATITQPAYCFTSSVIIWMRLSERGLARERRLRRRGKNGSLKCIFASTIGTYVPSFGRSPFSYARAWC